MKMINVQGIRRNMKNVVKNYSEAQVKVREATSNDPWGPSSTLMSEIADLTYNVVAFSEIMQMIWKRLNDHGKNWRHVYKALVLLEYLIKTGSEKVAQQCRENIFAIQTLKDFQYIEENKDQGMNVREKSKMLVALLKDEDKLKLERTRALKAKERFAQSMSYMGSSGSISENMSNRTSNSYHESLSTSGDHYAFGTVPTGRVSSSELEAARPQTVGEEELQLQLALAMSKEEAEQEERLRRNDDLRLKMALNESERNKLPPETKSAIDDLLTLNVGHTSATSSNSNSNTTTTTTTTTTDPWGVPFNNSSSNNSVLGNNAFIQPHNKPTKDPWSSQSPPDPWTTPVQSNKPISPPNNDPWQPSPSTTPINTDPWAPISQNGSNIMISPTLDGRSSLNPDSSPLTVSSQSVRKTPENFLGPNSNLVNLDALVSTKNSTLPTGGNPFAPTTATLSNPFQTAKPPQPTINQLRAQNQFSGPFDTPPSNSNQSPLQTMPIQQNNGNLFQSTSQPTYNPFSM